MTSDPSPPAASSPSPPGSGQPDVERYAADHPQVADSGRISAVLGDLVRRTPTGTIVDVGCGEGLSLVDLEASGVARGRLVGFERSHLRAAIGARRGLQVAVADGLALPVPDGGAALTLSRHVVEHVPDDAGFVAELARITAEGGLVYLETPRRLPGAWYLYRSPTDGRRVLDPTHLREYERTEQVTELLRTAGLEVIELTEVPVRFPLRELLLRVLPRAGSVGDRLSRAARAMPLSLRIPRYREIRVVARKPVAGGSPDASRRSAQT